MFTFNSTDCLWRQRRRSQDSENQEQIEDLDRQAELLERRRLRKLWQKEQRVKGQANGVKNPQVRTRKPKMENEGKSMKSMLLTEDVAKTDQHETSEMIGFTSEMIGFISVSLGCCTAQWQDDDLIEAQEHCSTEHAISKPTKIDSVHGGGKDNGRMVPSETCLRSCASGDNEADSHPQVAKSAPAEGLLFSSNAGAAEAFLAQSLVNEWKADNRRS
ncbi:hypothetical protein RHSIM_RhsimUnG0140300 [Rhododendron simsii]|uniref:Uncharacterized protein n=1 Tax=Rhododendron simsii TaxID=118357 RepID=A0A834L4M4_RHOSS|nr:hypothetical protein RHSIM_RhsimUnG0140300 [Rhododendron simsii]